MGSVATCKQQYCCGNRLNCTGPEDPPSKAETPSNNAPFAVIELTEEQYMFLLKNIESNMVLGLQLLAGTSTPAQAQPFVELIENFKSLRDAARKGKL